MDWYQIYRGQHDHGLGESPNSGEIFGEQYLDASPELWQKAPAGFHQYAAPWMTLDLEDIGFTTGEPIEAWSYFGYPGKNKAENEFRFSIRLFHNGPFGDRGSYLAHGWAWRAPDYSQIEDPGTLIGDPGSFSGTKRPGEERWIDVKAPPERPEEQRPEHVWRRLLTAPSEGENTPYREIATRLTAYLYRACALGSEAATVVMALPPEFFRVGGELARLVSFARAAMPTELKRDCRIRIHTSHPGVFLRDLKAHFVAVPEAFAADALKASPKAALLDANAARVYGEEIANTSWYGYARAVTARFLREPEELFARALFSFTAQVGLVAGLSKKELPDARALAVIPALYDLTAIENSDKLTEDRLVYALENPAKGVVLPWDLILRSDRLKGLPNSAIRKLGAVTPQSADSADSWALLKRIFAEAENRTPKIPIEVPPNADADRVLEHFAAGFIGETQAGELLRDKSVPAILSLLGKKARLAVVPARFTNLLGMANFEDKLPENWVEQLPQLGSTAESVERLLEVALFNEKRFEGKECVWAVVVFPTLKGLLALPGQIAPVIGDKAKQLRTFRSAEDWVIAAEVECRAGVSTPGDIVNQLAGWRDPQWRQWVLVHCEDEIWTFLRGFQIPKDWDDDCRTELLQSPAQLQRFANDPARVVKLAAASLPGPMPTAALEVLDEWMQNEVAMVRTALGNIERTSQGYVDRALKTTRTLIDHRQWLRWRLASRLTEGAWRDAAKAWLMDCRPGRVVLLEDWRQCVADLDMFRTGIKGEEIEQIGRVLTKAFGYPFKWPFQKLFRDEQIEQAVYVSGDYGALAEIADQSSYGLVEQLMQKRSPGLPAGFLHPLGSTNNGPPCDMENLRKLWRLAGHRRAKALSAIVTTVLDDIAHDPDEAVREAELEPCLWNEEQFAGRFLGVMIESRPGQIPPTFLKAANDRFKDSTLRPSINAKEQTQKQAELWLDRNSERYPNIAILLQRAGLKGHLIREAVDCLSSGRTSNCWVQISLLVDAGQLNPDPLLELLGALLRRGAPQTDDRVMANRFKDQWGRYSSLLYRNRDDRVPAFEIQAFLRPAESLGSVVSEFLGEAVRSPQAQDIHWWEALGNSMVHCTRAEGLDYWDRADQAFLLLTRQVRIRFADARPGVRRHLECFLARWQLGLAGMRVFEGEYVSTRILKHG